MKTIQSISQKTKEWATTKSRETTMWYESVSCKKIQHRTNKMNSTNPHLNPGVNPDVRHVSCSSLFLHFPS
jgi:hypothetical protein